MMKNVIKLLMGFIILGISLIMAINNLVVVDSKRYIIKNTDIKDDYDCILVLGAGINDDRPSKMLQERLDTSISIYHQGKTKKILMTGDHTRASHDEVNVMKQYAVSKGVKSEDIFMDHAGVSTYDSLYRAKYLYNVKKIIIVTQEYHLYRALHIAKKLGIEAIGVDSTKKIYAGQNMREIREVLARIKDYFKVMLKSKSTYLGNPLSLDNNGNMTNDKYMIISNDEKEIFLYQAKDIDKVSKIIDNYEFTTETCDGISKYQLDINGYLKYGIEVYDNSIHITKTGEITQEIALSEEDSKIILDLIN